MSDSQGSLNRPRRRRRSRTDPREARAHKRKRRFSPWPSTGSSNESYSDTRVTPPKSNQAALKKTSLCDSEQLGCFCHEWDATYNQRAVLARIVVRDRSRAGSVEQQQPNETPQAIVKLKIFGPKLEVEEYDVSVMRCNRLFDQPSVKRLSLLEIPELPPVWLEVKKGIEHCRMRYRRDQEDMFSRISWNCDTPKEDMLQKISLKAQRIVSSIRTAFKRDLENDEGKLLIHNISRVLASDYEVEDYVQTWPPQLHHGSNTQVEVLTMMQDQASGKNLHPSLERHPDRHHRQKPKAEGSFSNTSAKPEVPDYVWSTMGTREADGKFLLVVETRPESDVLSAVFKCYKQILSKMNNQRFIVGCVLTTQSYTVIIAIKVGKEIKIFDESFSIWKDMSHSVNTGASSTEQTVENIVFDVDSFLEFVRLLARIMQYAKDKMNWDWNHLVQDFSSTDTEPETELN